MSALRTTAESRAAWRENQLRLDRLYAAELAAELENRQGGNDHAAEQAAHSATPQGDDDHDEQLAPQAATPQGDDDHDEQLAPQAATPQGGIDHTAAAAAPVGAADASVGQPPQLNQYMPGSQAVDAAAASSADAQLPVWLPSTDAADAPGGAAAALGVADADCVDNRGHSPIRSPPAPPPAGTVQDGSQTQWNLVAGLRQPGDGGVTKVRKLAAFGPNRFAPFDNRPFKVPTVPSSSPPRPKPMTPQPPSPLPTPRQGSAGRESAGNAAETTFAASAPPPQGVPPLWTLSASMVAAAPWAATQAASASWTPAPVPGVAAPPPSAPSASDLEAETAAAAAAAAVIASVPPPSPASLAAPFPPLPAPRRRASGGKAKKRSTAKAPRAKSAVPPRKKHKAVDSAAGGDSDGAELVARASSSAPTPEAVAAWALVSGEVAKAVSNGTKELWAALKKTTAQMEHLRADSNRLEARVDGQGQCNERTAMAVASLRVAVRSGGHDGASNGVGTPGSSGKTTEKSRGKDVKPVMHVEDAKASAMALAPANDVQAAMLRRPVRAVLKHRIAATTASREVLMDPDMATSVIQEEVIKSLGVTPDAADSYLMNRIYFSSSTAGAEPTKKRPMAVIMTTIPHTMAQIREFVVKPFFKVLGFSYNPMPLSKAKKWSVNDSFLTSYKGEKAVVAAAKHMFMKVGGASRVVKDNTAGSRNHVEMVVGHHALIASFARNEFEIGLGNRTRRRGGNGTGAYEHWVDEFSTSIMHLSKSHKDNKVHGGYRITDAVDPNIVVRTTSGAWVFTAPAGAVAVRAARQTPKATAKASARPTGIPKRTADPSTPAAAGSSTCPTPATRRGATSAADGGTDGPSAADQAAGAMPNCAEDYDVGVDDEISVARHAPVVIVVDSDADHRAGAALIGIDEEGATSVGGGGNGGMSDGGMSDAGGGDARGSNERANDGRGTDGDDSDVGGRTSSSGSSDSDASSGTSDEGDESGDGFALEDDEEEA